MKDPIYYKNGVECTIDDEPTHIFQEDGTYMIKQVETGIPYSEALDVFPCPYTYEVTDTLIPTEPLSPEEQLEELGVDHNYTNL